MYKRQVYIFFIRIDAISALIFGFDIKCPSFLIVLNHLYAVSYTHLNDQEGKYFPDQYIAELCTPDGKRYKEYFVNQTEIFKWFDEISGQSVESITEILAIAEQWKDENDKSFLSASEKFFR